MRTLKSTLLLLLGGLLLLLFSFGELYAQSSWRYRVLNPYSESGTLQSGNTASTDTPKTYGLSQHLVFTSRFGVGYSHLNTEGKVAGNTHILRSKTLDISYTWGDDTTITLGAALVVDGKADTTVAGIPYTTGEARGGSVFSVFGIPLGFFEFLIGVRKDEIQFKSYTGEVNGVPQKLSEDIQVNSQHLSFGMGLVF